MIYAERFPGADLVGQILGRAQEMVNDTLAATPDRSTRSSANEPVSATRSITFYPPKSRDSIPWRSLP